MPLMRRTIERRLGPDRPVVVGVAPHQAADGPCRVKTRIRTLDVARGLIFGQERGSTFRFRVTVPRRRAEFGEQHVPAAQPTRDGGEECDELRIGRPAAPRRVDRVAMHGDDIADPRRLGRSDTPVVLEVLHVQAQRDPARSVGRSDRPSDPLQPAHSIVRGRRHAAVRVLVAKIPSPEGRVSGESAGALAREERLRLEDEGIHVPVAHRALDDLIVRDDAKPPARSAAREGPLRDEIRSAHMTGEKRRDDPQTVAPRRVRHGREERDRTLTDRRRLRLEVLPEQEEPDELAARLLDAREVPIDLARVETAPPAHGTRGRPVVDADVERLAHAICAPDTTFSYTRR